VITYPGTDVPFTYTLDITEHPEEAAPLLFDAVSRIHSNYVALRENPIPLFITPFSSVREREESSVVQQTLWIYTAALEGDPYTIEDFEDKMVDQLETSTGQDFMEMDERVQDQLTAGVEQFWDAFTLVGTQAKVIRETPVSTPEPVLTVQKEERFCEYQIGERPDSVFKMEIDDSWKDLVERARIIAEARQDIFSQGHWSPGEGYYTLEGGLRHHPTSASAFFRNNVIGGFCSGYAKAYLYEAGKGSEYVSSTEPINLNVGNTSAMVTMTVVPPPRWTAFVVGSSFTKLRASSSSFDAVAGNSEFGLDFLRVTKFAAKTSLKFLFDLATGQTTQTFLDYAKEAIKDELKSLTEEAAKEKLTKFINENFNDLLDELDVDLEDIQNIGEGNFKALIKDKLRIEIGSLDDLIDQGLDAALNLLFVSNTYAAANGGLVVKIGGQSEDALVHSRALYLRQELEDSGEAVAGTGEKVDSFYVSDVKENTITIETIGNVLMMTRAKGNGTADAYVESMQLQALVGVCKGPRPRYEWNTEIIAGAYFHDQDNAPSMDESFIDQLVDGLDAKITAELDYDSSPEDWKNTVDAFIREKSLEYPFNK
jgi:hypothetical protein